MSWLHVEKSGLRLAHMEDIYNASSANRFPFDWKGFKRKTVELMRGLSLGGAIRRAMVTALFRSRGAGASPNRLAASRFEQAVIDRPCTVDEMSFLSTWSDLRT